MPLPAQPLATATVRPDRMLDEALQCLHPGEWALGEPSGTGTWQRAELAVSDTDPLVFLRHLTTATEQPVAAHYWADRAHELESAGVGVAVGVTGNDGVCFADVCRRVTGVIGCRRQRLYGGFRFRGDSGSGEREPLWEPFGSYRFILPRLELTRTDSGTTLACNFQPAEHGALQDEIRAFAPRCRTALQAGNGAADREARRLVPMSALSHVPDRRRWQQIVAEVLQRFDHRLDGGPTPLQKIVLARRTTFAFRERVAALAMLQRLRVVNPAAFHFAVQPYRGLTFFGASPERLLRITGTTLETEALAGTRPRGTDADADSRLEAELLRSDKELREHGFVHTRIAECLRELCTTVTTQDVVRVRKLAHVQHLHTSFSGTLRSGLGLADALRWLHPTPAVGGYPTCGVSDLIAETEGFDRGWYAGPIGWVGAATAEFAVAIRSGVAAGSRLHLYAGNGIVRGSTAAAEWAEMEQKILQILDVV